MRITESKKINDARTASFKHVLKDITPISTINAILILTSPQRPGGEMYGM